MFFQSSTLHSVSLCCHHWSILILNLTLNKMECTNPWTERGHQLDHYFTVSQVMPIYTIYCCSLQTCSIWFTNFLFSLSRHSDQQFYSFQPQFPLDKMKWDTLEPPLIGHPLNTSKRPLNRGWLLNTINEHTIKFRK